jgi:hypothetical protein
VSNIAVINIIIKDMLINILNFYSFMNIIINSSLSLQSIFTMCDFTGSNLFMRHHDALQVKKFEKVQETSCQFGRLKDNQNPGHIL